MPNKDGGKCAPSALAANDTLVGGVSTAGGRTADKMGKSVGMKNTSAKVSWKGVEVMGNGASPESPTEELLGSVTSSGGGEGAAVRTSARVIKKMKLDSAVPAPIPEPIPSTHQRKDSIREVDKPDEAAPSKAPGDKQSGKIVKCRTPKALWSSTEKNLFFEALNEYGKDFDSITAYICNKMKRKGVPDSSTKAKHQVSTFYYRTWQKVSKYLKFDDDVKKVVQELYALINYGELRKRMDGGIGSSKVGARLGELVRRGVVAVRWRGRTLRVRTPVCRALRTLNQLHEWEEQLRLPVRVVVQLCARDSEAWRVVQGAAHNPRVLAPAPPSLRLHLLLHLLHRRWTTPLTKDAIPDLHEKNSLSCFNSLDCQISSLLHPPTQTALKLESQELIYNGLIFPADRALDTNNLIKESKANDPSNSSKSDIIEGTDEIGGKNNNINASNIVPNCVVNGSEEDLTTHNKTAKRVVDGATDNNRLDDNRNTKVTNSISNVNISTSQQQQEVLFQAGYRDKFYLHVGPKPGLTFSLPTVSVGEHLTSQRICLNSYQERLRNNSLFSGLQNGTGFKGGGRFKNQKRSRKDSGEIEATRENKKGKSSDSNNDNNNCDIKPDLFDIDETANDGMDIMMDFKIIDEDEKEKDFLSEIEDDGECEGENKQRDQGEDVKQSVKIKVPDRSKKENQKVEKQPGAAITDSPEDVRVNTTSAVAVLTSAVTHPAQSATGNGLKSWNRDVLLQQIKKGWSISDAGDLTIGDLYLMFGSESKLELEYWWCEPSPPMQQRNKQSMVTTASDVPVTDTGTTTLETPLKADVDKDGIGDSDKDAVDALLMSPTHTSQDSNDTEKEMMSPDHKQNPAPEDPSIANGFPLVSKIINCPPSIPHYSPPGCNDSRSPEQRDVGPLVVPSRDRIVSISSRLKKLLSVAKLYDAKGTKTGCSCGHFCASSRLKFRNPPAFRDDVAARPALEYPWQRVSLSNNQEAMLFRTPLPKLAVRPSPIRTTTPALGFDKLPPWTKRGGRPRQVNVAPQRFNILPRPVIQNLTSITRPLVPIPAGSTTVPTTSSSTSTLTSSASKALPKLRPKPCVVTVRPSITLERSPAASSSTTTNPVDVKPDICALETARPVSKVTSTSYQISETDVPEQFFISSKPAEGNNIVSGGITNNNNNNNANSNGNKWREAVKQEMADMTPSLANLLDISLPSNICDDNSIGMALKPHRSDVEDKHDNFTGLLQAESMSMSPSRLLKENDHQWFESDVHNFSLSSFLGHLEGPPATTSSKCGGKADDESNTVDTSLHCLMNDSIDYMAKFEDLAKRASAEATK